MTPEEQKHRELTVVRAQAYEELFGTRPSGAYPFHQFSSETPPRILVDVFAYRRGTVTILNRRGLEAPQWLNSPVPSRSRCIAFVFPCLTIKQSWDD